MKRFKLTPLTDKEKWHHNGIQICMYLGDTESSRLHLGALLLSRLCDPDQYEQIAELSTEEQLPIIVELFDSLNETQVWQEHSLN